MSVRESFHAGNRLVAAIGIDQLVIVETADAALVADRSRVQDVGALVERLHGSRHAECRPHGERDLFRLSGQRGGSACDPSPLPPPC